MKQILFSAVSVRVSVHANSAVSEFGLTCQEHVLHYPKAVYLAFIGSTDNTESGRIQSSTALNFVFIVLWAKARWVAGHILFPICTFGASRPRYI